MREVVVRFESVTPAVAWASVQECHPKRRGTNCPQIRV